MSDKATYTALSKQEVVIPAYSVVTIDYMDTTPNYFRVQNQGETAIYCGTSAIPTNHKYDFMVAPKGMKMFAEPFKRAKLYLFNPSGTEIRAVALTFQAEFDPLALALSEISLDFSSLQLESNMVISGFNSALPTGNNKIGKVEVTNFPNYTTVLNNILTALNNLTNGEAVEY